MIKDVHINTGNPLFGKLVGLYEYFKPYKYSIIFSVIACLLLACVYQMYNQPVYRINSILHIDGIHKNYPAVTMPGNKNLSLKSKSILHKAIKESPLMATYEIYDGEKIKELYTDLSPIHTVVNRISPAYYKKSITIRILNGNKFEVEGKGLQGSYAFDTSIQTPDIDFKVVSNNNPKYISNAIHVRFNNPNELASVYAGKLDIKTNSGDNNNVLLSVTESHPQKGIDFLNKLSDVYAQLRPANKKPATGKLISAIDDSMQIIKDELVTIDKKGREPVQIKNPPAPVKTVKKVSDKQEAVFTLVKSYLQKPLNTFTQLPGYSTNDLELDKKITDYNTLQLQKQIDRDEKLIADLGIAKTGILQRIDQLQGTEQVQIARTTVKPVVSNKPSKKMQLLKSSKEKELEKLISEKKNLMVKTASPKISIVKKPSYSRIPFVFEATLLYLGAVLIGLVLPMPVIYAKNLMTKNVLSITDIQNNSNISIIGYFSHHGQQTGKPNSIADFGRYKYELSVMIDQLEKLSGNNKSGKIIIVSSQTSGEGKSYLSNHLSTMLSGLGKQVVFVDMNMVNYTDNDNLGLTNFIADKNLTENDVLNSSPKSPNLYFIGAGNDEKKQVYDDLPFYQWEVGKQERSRFESPRIKELITKLKKRFDYIILDTPSLTQEPVIETIFNLADVQLHMVRYNYTKKTSLKNQNITVKKSKKEMFIVFNDIKHTSPQFYKTTHSNYQA